MNIVISSYYIIYCCFLFNEILFDMLTLDAGDAAVVPAEGIELVGSKREEEETFGALSISSAVSAVDATSDDDVKARLSSMYRWRANIFIVFGFWGFLPGFMVFVHGGNWYTNVWYRLTPDGYPFDGNNTSSEAQTRKSILTLHAFCALCWIALSASQVYSGATQGEKRRAAHRFLGTWVSPFVVVGFTFGGMVTSYYKNSVGQHFSPKEYLELPSAAIFGIVTFLTWAAAYWAAKVKRYNMHKDLIVVAIGVSVAPGIERCWMYFWQMVSNIECNALEVGGGVVQPFGFSFTFALNIFLFGSVWVSLGRLRSHAHLRCSACLLIFFALYYFIDFLRIGIISDSFTKCPSGEYES